MGGRDDGVMTESCCGGGVCGCEDFAPLIDVTGVPLADLFKDASVQIKRSVQRVVDSLDDPNGVISAFSSFVE
jgi:hypothetical protein